MSPLSTPPLRDIRVLDIATLYAGPLAATLLGDFGADVVKIEHPRGDPLRHHGETKDGHPLWWKMIGRNKRCITLDLRQPEGQELFCRMIPTSDIVVESFRPGVLESWGLGYDRLSSLNPRLIMLRLTGFGQFGPYAAQAGFGTQAECISGWVYSNGYPDGSPTLPPFGLADPTAGLAGAFACMLALHHRTATGRGQAIDASLIEPMLMLTGPQITYYDQLGIVAERIGNRGRQSAPRNIYRCRDGQWVAVSASAPAVAERVLTLVGHAPIIGEPWFKTAGGRAAHADLLDKLVGEWIATRDMRDVLTEFARADAAISPINDVAQVIEDTQYRALNAVTQVEDRDLGPIRMQNVLFRLSRSPGAVRFSGRGIGEDNEAIYCGELGLDQTRLARLRTAGVI